MKKTLLYPMLLLLLCLPGFSVAQGIIAVDDFFSFTLGQPAPIPAPNVKINDTLPSLDFPVRLIGGDTSCFRLANDGTLIFIGSPNCCGNHVLLYEYEQCDVIKCQANIFVQVLCKPDCFFVNLENPASGTTGDKKCVFACENSTSNYYVSFDPANSYTWSVTGGTFVPGANAADILVTWGPAGSGFVSVLITASNNTSKLVQSCVDILQSPVADFSAPDTVCLEQSVTFNNTSTGGSSFFWDFGDGQTATMFSPTHTYAAPGAYTVCLVATRQNFDEQGNALCCCTDSICKTIVVDPLQGPDINCISTLCAKDSSEYWTNAANCSSYFWAVQDESGAALPFSGQGTNRISVQWGDGPVGTVSLYVTGCDELYCADTASVTVPIISATTPVNGPTVVCSGAVETYTVQKWISAQYDWTVMNGIIIEGDGTNSVVVQWGAPGTGTLKVDYYSDFLSGVPGHEPSNCMGTSAISVDIKPRFELNGPLPPVACLNDVSNFSAFPATAYTWSINPAASFTGQGTNAIAVTWDAGPGVYVVTAKPDDPTLFCNEQVTQAMLVVEVPVPLGIDGPAEVCPGETYTYFGQSSETGVGFDWVVTGGVPATGNGYTIDVSWDLVPPAGGYQIALSQSLLGNPFCKSDTIQLAVSPIQLDTPVIITGPATACRNGTGSYSASPLQHPEAQYYWSITPAHLGSVVGGQGSPNISVQWNNDVDSADVSLTISLCNESTTTTIRVPVDAPLIPVITQLNSFCAGQTTTLDAGAGFCGYAWSVPGNNQTIVVSTGGVYSVTTTDCNGCTATGAISATVLPGPPANLPDPVILCIQPANPASATLTTPPGYSYNWSPAAPNTNSITHVNTDVAGTFVYVVTVTDIFGCTNVASSTVIQDICDPCSPPVFSLSFTDTPDLPNCNIIDFVATRSANVTLSGWDFDDPNDPVNGGPVDNISHTYTQAGCYNVVLSGLVPNQIGPGNCGVLTSELVCVDVAANFSSVKNCETVTFTDLSSVDIGQPPISSWSWNFDDGSSPSSLQNPVHVFPGPGSYNVTLTVSNGLCQATIVKEVIAGGASKPIIATGPGPFCVDKPVQFTAAAAGVVSWLWDFGDGATNANQNVDHTFIAAGLPYMVILTVTDIEGCENKDTLLLNVHPLPPAGAITAVPGLQVCAGTPVTLTASPAGPGYTYLWSTFDTTPAIVATTGGAYSVTVTDPNGCTTVPEPVTVVFTPLPTADISGSHFICNSGCITLATPLGSTYTYQWSDIGGPIAAATTSSLMVCSAGLASPYQVVVTDGNTLCSNTSSLFDVQVVPAPAFSIDISPDDCEGMPVTLKVVPVQVGVSYAWSNGATGPSTVVTQAGTYIAIGTDMNTGCQGSASAVIHPLPDLCLVPVGCYNVCNPDTICGPEGLAAYQWNRNGIPLAGETGQCLIVTQSGDYSLTGTTNFGCALTSDTLHLMSNDCNCFGLEVAAVRAGADNCCWTLSYVNPFNDKFGLAIRSDDTDFIPTSGSLDPGLQISVNNPDFIGIETNPVGLPLPSGALNNFLSLCLTNIQNNPQQIIFDWYDTSGAIVCSDTLDWFTQASRSDTLALCPGETVVIDGTAYSAPATVSATVSGLNGACDTLVTYTLVSLLPAPSLVTITCPANISLVAPTGATDMVVNYPDPVTTSNCPCPGIQLELTSGLPSGSLFPAGATTTVCYTATDSCGNTASCCFTVEVIGSTACDTKTIGCVKYELLSITKNTSEQKTYRIRVTNNCPNKLIYTAFQLPNGLNAVAPVDNSVYTAPSGKQYLVRNPNATPFHSIRFKSTADSLANGESDIFTYTLPAQAEDVDYIHVVTRVTPKIFYEAYLNTFNCPVGSTISASSKPKLGLHVFPNPSNGLLFADLSDWKGTEIHLRVMNMNGQGVLNMKIPADAAPQSVPLPADLAAGVYTLEVLTAEGERHTVRFALIW